MRVVRLVAMGDGWISRNSKPATRACNRPAFTRLASAWWRQADLSVSTNTRLAFAHRLALLDWLHSLRRKVQTCSRNHVFLYISYVRSHVCVPQTIRATMRRVIAGNLGIVNFFFSMRARTINYLLYTHCFVHPRIIFARASLELAALFLTAFLLPSLLRTINIRVARYPFDCYRSIFFLPFGQRCTK